MIPFDEALSIVNQHRFVGSNEVRSLWESVGYVLAEDIIATFPMPRFRNSAMDGYAVGSLQGPWAVTHAVAAGEIARAIGIQEAARILTGAPVPQGAIAVIPQEECTARNGNVDGPCREGAHIREVGEDIHEGQCVAMKGVRITPAVISACAAFGVTSVQVRSRPKVALIVTGNELQVAGTPLGDADLYDSNRPGLESALAWLGSRPDTFGCPDDLDVLCDRIEMASTKHDLILTTAGVSVGDHDYVRPAMERLGFEIHFAGVGMKPGKPVTFARRGEVSWIALPGNPMSALTTFALFATTWLGREPRWRWEALVKPYSHKPGREAFVPVRFRMAGVEPLTSVGSHAVAGLVGAEGLARVPADRPDILPGEIVQVCTLPWGCA